MSFLPNTLYGGSSLVNGVLIESANLNCDLTTQTCPNIGTASMPMNDIYCNNIYANGGGGTSANGNFTNITVANLLASNICMSTYSHRCRN